MDNKRITILGLGWLGLPLALQLEKAGCIVNGSTTTLNKLNRLASYSFNSCVLKVEHSNIFGDWKTFTAKTDVLIINFPPKRIDNIQDVYPLQVGQIIRNTPKTTKVIFVSATSVYQNTNNLVDESVICVPEKASGRALLKAEQLLQKHFGSNITILRLAGLIGPKRHPGRFLANKKQLKNPNTPVNLIHQKDCIRLIEAIITQDCFGELINGCADVHPNRKDFYEKAAVSLNLTAPAFVLTNEEKFKIVDNSKSKRLLNFEYQFKNPEWIFKKEFNG
mgnify:CR=1 FL=1